MKYLKLFESQDHLLLDFFQDIRDEYDLKLSENHYRASIQISNVSRTKNTNPDILQIISIMDSELTALLNSCDLCKDGLVKAIQDFKLWDNWITNLNPIIRKIPLIQKIEEMTDYRFHRFSELGFIQKNRDTFDISFYFVES